ncbi:hypothetical protein J5N97_025220 [Dioscorea zingiberensis]|uniref:Uncharacterized protein n=1 Tax=Dioscorea zingiberensis TaxID=325984 RepID=A0A9D5C8J7_9LILI|nr:hypothetical protein J5N97_025220 [Dioscorea zingiberensis]
MEKGKGLARRWAVEFAKGPEAADVPNPLGFAARSSLDPDDASQRRQKKEAEATWKSQGRSRSESMVSMNWFLFDLISRVFENDHFLPDGAKVSCLSQLTTTDYYDLKDRKFVLYKNHELLQ